MKYIQSFVKLFSVNLTVNVNIPLLQPDIEALLEDPVQGVGGHALTADSDGRVLQLVDGVGRGGHGGQDRVVLPGLVRILGDNCSDSDLDRYEI